MNRRNFLTGTAGLFGSVLLSGCGGGSVAVGGSRGSAKVSVKWPERSRYIPEMANSLVLQMYEGLTVLDTITLNRPSSGESLVTTANFNDLPVKTFELFIEAFPNADGTGIAQGAALESVTVTHGGTASVTAVMFTTIASVEIASVGNSTSVPAGTTLQLTATPKDHDGNIVITPNLVWASFDSAKATVSASGLVTGIAAGSVLINAEDSESQISNTFNLTVT